MWPPLFDINDIAKLVLHFLPHLQLRQWVLDCFGEEQSKLCAWITNLDREMKRSAIKNNNKSVIDCIFRHGCASLGEWKAIARYASPTLLTHVFTHTTTVPPGDFFTMFDIPLANLQVIAHHVCIEITTRSTFINLAIAKCNHDALSWMLDTEQWMASIFFDDTIQCGPNVWQILQPHVKAGRVTCTCDLMHMPPEMCHSHITTLTAVERSRLFVNYFHSNNYELASFLWMPCFAIDDHLTFEIDIKMPIPINEGYDIFQKFGLFGIMSDDYHEMANCEYALAFIGPVTTLPSHPTCFKDAMLLQIAQQLLSLPNEKRNYLFRRGCTMGTFHIVMLIWNMSRQQEQLRPFLILCFQCANPSMLAFAWREISPEIAKNKNNLFCDAYNRNNVDLWQFLHAHNLITHDQVLFIHDTIGSKPVVFLKTLWSSYLNIWHDTKHATTLLSSAINSRNVPLLLFLEQQTEFVPDKLILLDKMEELCPFRLPRMLLQIADNTASINDQRLCACYAKTNANMAVVETLWTLVPRIPAKTTFVEYMNKYTRTTIVFPHCVDMYVFFVRRGFLNAHDLWQMLFPHKDIAPKTFDRVFATLYYDIDFP